MLNRANTLWAAEQRGRPRSVIIILYLVTFSNTNRNTYKNDWDDHQGEIRADQSTTLQPPVRSRDDYVCACECDRCTSASVLSQLAARTVNHPRSAMSQAMLPTYTSRDSTYCTHTIRCLLYINNSQVIRQRKPNYIYYAISKSSTLKLTQWVTPNCSGHIVEKQFGICTSDNAADLDMYCDI